MGILGAAISARKRDRRYWTSGEAFSCVCADGHCWLIVSWQVCALQWLPGIPSTTPQVFLLSRQPVLGATENHRQP